MGDEVMVRRAGADDLDAVRSVAGEALGWMPDEPNAELFAWKHLRNPFGHSPMWIAEIGGEPVGFRTFLRWEWRSSSGRVLRAVRAVDTATLPAFQGRGIFRSLTTAALDELPAEGVDFVFNTPNDKSRPGYLSMGWEVIGRVEVTMRPLALRRLGRLRRARVPAERWSVPTDAAEPAAAVLSDRMGLAALLDATATSRGLRTNLSPAYLQWRYAGGPITYRAVTGDGGVAGGVAFFRIRRRGPVLECVLADVIVPDGGDADQCRRRLERQVCDQSGADVALRVSKSPALRSGWLRLAGQGPVLTWRPVNESVRPSLDGWALCLGDIELF